tara:strand:+ start:1362 stop:1556 length:195 start_codon:yes stop_codon:yes gene_type:complete
VDEAMSEISTRSIDGQLAMRCNQIVEPDKFGDIFVSAKPVINQGRHALRAEILVELYHINVGRS